jgi:hypothetical protein
LWFVITFVTTSRCSVADASRTLVRLARRRADASRERWEWKSCDALET